MNIYEIFAMLNVCIKHFEWNNYKLIQLGQNVAR